MKQNTALSGVMGRDLTTVLIHNRWTKVDSRQTFQEKRPMLVNKALRLKSVVDVTLPASRPGLVPPVMQPIRSKIYKD